jgi:hypothetical protein
MRERIHFLGIRPAFAGGMPEKQERGAIATLKSLSYDSENLIVDMLH